MAADILEQIGNTMLTGYYSAFQKVSEKFVLCWSKIKNGRLMKTVHLIQNGFATGLLQPNYILRAKTELTVLLLWKMSVSEVENIHVEDEVNLEVSSTC